jgi:hypothetical protein
LAVVSPSGGQLGGHDGKSNSSNEECANGSEQYQKKLVREIRQMFRVNENIGQQDAISTAKYSKLSSGM